MSTKTEAQSASTAVNAPPQPPIKRDEGVEEEKHEQSVSQPKKKASEVRTA